MQELRLGRPAALAVAMMVGLCAAGSAVAQVADEASIDALIESSRAPGPALVAAKGQVQQGDLLGAAATLERVLSADPGLRADELRLYYATVLCRLDDRRRAAYQFANVPDAAAAGWDEARQACGDIAVPGTGTGRRGGAGSGVHGVAWLGVAHDGDAYSALSPLLTGVVIPGAGADGTSLAGGLDVQGRWGMGERGFGYGGMSLFAKDSISGPRLEYQGVAGRLGFGSRIDEAIELAGGVVARHVQVQGDPFVREIGPQASLRLGSGASRWAIEAEAVNQRYLGAAANAVRDGRRYDLSATFRHSGDGDLEVVAGMAYEDKNAARREFGYRGGRVFAAAQWPIAANGTYVNLSTTLRRLDYRNVAWIPDIRERRLFARAAVGIPLGRRLALEPAATYTRRDYNAASGYRDYRSLGAELRLVFRFGEK